MLRLFALLVLVMVASCANSECPICDPNDYSPVCSSGKAFKSVCDLVRQNCLGTVVLKNNNYGDCLKAPSGLNTVPLPAPSLYAILNKLLHFVKF